MDHEEHSRNEALALLARGTRAIRIKAAGRKIPGFLVSTIAVCVLFFAQPQMAKDLVSGLISWLSEKKEAPPTGSHVTSCTVFIGNCNINPAPSNPEGRTSVPAKLVKPVAPSKIVLVDKPHSKGTDRNGNDARRKNNDLPLQFRNFYGVTEGSALALDKEKPVLGSCLTYRVLPCWMPKGAGRETIVRIPTGAVNQILELVDEE
jgi:hypothetical protein